MATRHLQKHFWLILCLPPCSHFPTMAEEEFSAVVADNGNGTCNSEFAGGRGRRESKRECAKLHHTPHTRTTTTKQHTPPTPHTTPHVHTQNTTHHTHHTTYQATDRDLESVFVKRKVNARICAHQSTDRDLESVFNVNAWICACQTTDRDLETKK